MSVQVPLSEDEGKFHAEWTREDCIKELRKIAEANPEQVITRNFFRNHSKISEATWNRYFGTFHEFKRQAGIILSRHAHRLERDIAKHASVDTLRDMQIEKTDYAGKYKRDIGGRFKTALIASDIHDVECDPFYCRLFLSAVARIQPEAIILGGDIFDLPEFSKYTQDPREWNPIERIKWVHAFLEAIREAAPDAEIIFIEGNHEFRLLRHLSEQTPAMVTILSDLHGMTISSLLGLDKYEINYIAPADLTAWTEANIKKELRRNWHIVWDSFIVHHFPQGRNMGYPGVNGHHHKHIVWPGFSPNLGAFEWHQLGCGHRRSAGYCNGELWSNGFMVAHCDTQGLRTQFEYIDCTHDHVMFGGELYVREAQERV